MIQFLARAGLPFFIAAVLGGAQVFVVQSVLAQGASQSVAREYQRLAEQGDANAQAQLGYLYYTGEGVPQNYAEAVKWYQKAAVQGNRDSQYNLAVAYAFGEGIRQDYKEAALWYRRAAEQGHTAAQYSLGISYSYGEGVPLDPKEAARWFRAAAEQGYVRAQVMLGSKYHTGDGVQQDFNEAVKWYRMAADRGDAAAQYNLGSLYRSGKGVPQDYKQAMRWYRLAADQGYAAAQNELVSLERAVGGAARGRAAPQMAPPVVTASAPAAQAAATATPAPAPQPEAQASTEREPLFSVERSELLTIKGDTPGAPSAQPATEPVAEPAVAPEPAMEAVASSEPAPPDAAEPASESTQEEAIPADETAPRRGVLGFLGRLFKPGGGKPQEPVEVAESAPIETPVEVPPEISTDVAETAPEEPGQAMPFDAPASETELLAMDDLEPALPEHQAQPATDSPSGETAADDDVSTIPGYGEPAAEDDEAGSSAAAEQTTAGGKPGGIRGFFGRMFSGKKKDDVSGEAAAAEQPIAEESGTPDATGDDDVAASFALDPELVEAPGAAEELGAPEVTDTAAPDRQAEIESALEAVAETEPEITEPSQAEVRETPDDQASNVALPTEMPAATAQDGMEPEETGATVQEPAPEEQRGFFGRLFGRKPVPRNEDAGQDFEPDVAEGDTAATTDADAELAVSSENADAETADTGTEIEDRPAKEDTAGADEEQPRRGFFRRLFGKADQPPEDDGIPEAQDVNAEIVAMAEPAPEAEVALPGPTGRSDPAALEAAMQALERGEYEQAFSAFSELSAQGDVFAQFQVGSLFYQGVGVEQDYESAALWYRRAAEQGNADAQYSLGNMFLMGEGVQQDDGKAAFWYGKASEAGHAAARHNLQNLQRLKDDSVVRAGDIAEGDEDASPEAPDGQDSQAAAGIGTQEKGGFFGRLFGRKSDGGTKQETDGTDPASVDTPVVDEAEESTPPIETESGGQEESIEPAAVPPDGDAAEGEPAPDSAVEDGGVKKFFGRLFGGKKHTAESADDAPAPTTEAEITAETAITANAADSGNEAEAAYQTGIAYSLGDGVSRDSAEAFKWFLTAAELGHAPAQYKIGAAYAYGEGTDKDPRQAAHWYAKAAAQGYAIAQRNLGIMYLSGDGVDQNKPLALAWYTILADGGNLMDVRRRDLLVQELSESELAEARQIMDQLRAEMSATR